MKHSDPMLNNIKQTLDQQTLDTDTRRKLAQARQQALQPVRPWWRINYLVPAMVMASLIAITLVLNLNPGQRNISITPSSIETFEILSSRDDELELYENLDFYIWLDEEGLPKT
jgi:hypothetical protein